MHLLGIASAVVHGFQELLVHRDHASLVSSTPRDSRQPSAIHSPPPMYISSPAQLPYTPHVLVLYFMFIITPHLIVYMHKTPFHETLLLHLLLQPKRDVVRFFDIHIPR